MAVNYFNLGTVAQVGLLQNEDNVLQPFLLNEIEQLPARLRPWIRHRKNEEHHIGSRNEPFGDRLVLGHHRVGSRSIDDVEILEERNRQISFRQLGGYFDRFVLGPVAENVNAVCCRQDIDFREILAEKRIQQRRFSRFHFADDDKEQRLANVLQQSVERVGRERGVEGERGD